MSRKKDDGKPPKKKQMNCFMSGPLYKEWLLRLTKFIRSDHYSNTIDRALASYAKRQGFPEAPPDRLT